MRRLVLTCLLLLAAAVPPRAQQAVSGQVLNLSCMEALVAIGRRELAGIFYFVPEKDAPQAFADFLMHDKKSLKLFVAKVAKDKKAAAGVAAWDRETLTLAIALYESPLKSTLADPGEKVIVEMRELAAAPVVPLELLENARRKG